MNKLELKHIVGYLPYKLECKYKDWEKPFQIVGTSGNTLLFEGDWTRLLSYPQSPLVPLEFIKPILRPLTDLVKEIDGVVHAIELAKLNLKYKPLHSPFVDKDGEILFTCNLINKPFGKVVKVTNFDTWVLYLSISQPERLSMYLIDYLYSNHFDIYGLIEQNLAIDINTL